MRAFGALISVKQRIYTKASLFLSNCFTCARKHNVQPFLVNNEEPAMCQQCDYENVHLKICRFIFRRLMTMKMMMMICLVNGIQVNAAYGLKINKNSGRNYNQSMMKLRKKILFGTDSSFF